MEKKNKFRLKFLFQEFDLQPGAFVIGRSPSCNLTLDDPLASRRHAQITIHDDYAVLDDLGSRNGTLVNGEPVFDNFRLSNADRIRIGAHDLVFIQEKRQPPAQQRQTGIMIKCASCSMSFAEGAPCCPHCQAPVPTRPCPHCGIATTKSGRYCSKCGGALEREDATIPVTLSDSSGGWTAQLVEEVIEKALSVQRYEQAARLIDAKIVHLDKLMLKGEIDLKALETLSRFNASVATGLKESARLNWIVDRYRTLSALIPEALFHHIVTEARGWCDLKHKLKSYMTEMQSQQRPPEERDALTRIGKLIDELR